MLTLTDIVKDYEVGDRKVPALRGVSIKFRRSEFVSILGQSGCGKTTLLNIIGGLDHYTEGDLIIEGRSTKKFKDPDWDTYRNHSIGFVFQSYNLIPHQNVLSNVELALTLSGVSKSERRRRAIEALEKVGLGDQINKRPNQMSGGQMQRVAIARALVNDPEILLADEPTGALDSETSVQIMEILKEISKDKLIIMVTHNPDLAKQYSTRIVKLLDGRIVDDSKPYEGEETEAKKDMKGKKKSMSFFTALSLSFHNLLTKKGRTFMTAFAGSIGIIGIALILSVSTGVQRYIDTVQRDTLSSYPITMKAETVDSSALMKIMLGVQEKDEDAEPRDENKVYANSSMYEMVNSLNNLQTEKNNLRAFKKYLEENEEMQSHISSVQYAYDMDLSIYTKDVDGKVVKSDVQELMKKMMSSYGVGSGMMSSSMGAMYSGMTVWSEMVAGEGGELVSPMLKEQYDVIYGEWPKAYDEVVLIVNEENEVSDMVLYALGLTTMDKLIQLTNATMSGETVEQTLGPWSFEEICAMEFCAVLAADRYQKQADGSYVDLSATDAGLTYMYENSGFPVKVSGIVRPNKDAASASMSGAIGYTCALTQYVMKENVEKELVKAQLADKENDVILGLPFKSDKMEELTTEQKREKVTEFLRETDQTKKAEIATELMTVPSEEYLIQTATAQLGAMDEAAIRQMVIAALTQQVGIEESQIAEYVNEMDEAQLRETAVQIIAAMAGQQYAEQMQQQIASMTVAELADAMDRMLSGNQLTDEQFLSIYEKYLPKQYSDSDYDSNLRLLGYADPESPSGISIYAETFEDKDAIADLIKKYNAGVAEEDVIKYTDYVALLMSSITTIINAISYVLIAFVAISLVVSSIMIGIITYISVLERTKEIGVLRAIGASKKDVSRVFNAETLIVGFTSGAIGIGVSLLFIVIINIILHNLTHIASLNAVLPVSGAVILILISMFLTFIAGLFPSRVAAKKDPVIALRTE